MKNYRKFIIVIEIGMVEEEEDFDLEEEQIEKKYKKRGKKIIEKREKEK